MSFCFGLARAQHAAHTSLCDALSCKERTYEQQLEMLIMMKLCDGYMAIHYTVLFMFENFDSKYDILHYTMWIGAQNSQRWVV